MGEKWTPLVIEGEIIRDLNTPGTEEAGRHLLRPWRDMPQVEFKEDNYEDDYNEMLEEYIHELRRKSAASWLSPRRKYEGKSKTYLADNSIKLGDYVDPDENWAEQ